MGELRLTVIGMGELRTLFSHDAAVEEHLRSVAAQAFPAETTPKQKGLLGKLGPVTRLPGEAPIVKPGVPTGQDVTDLTHGRFIKADRLGAAWALVRVWLDATGWPTLAIGIDEASINDLDFELATGGVPTEFGLRRLLNGHLGLPLRDAPGQVTGYVGFEHARTMRETWRPALPTLSPANGQTAQHIVGWLGGLEQWAEFARQQGRPAPDLVCSFTQS